MATLDGWLRKMQLKRGWTCLVCTTRHEGDTKDYLFCANCEYPKGTQRPLPLVDGSDRADVEEVAHFEEVGDGPTEDGAPEVVLCGNQPLNPVT